MKYSNDKESNGIRAQIKNEERGSNERILLERHQLHAIEFTGETFQNAPFV